MQRDDLTHISQFIASNTNNKRIEFQQTLAIGR